MQASPQDEEKLLIRCPACRQRFKVGHEFQNRMVECGVCENRFRINDEVIIRIRKFYPGENRHHGLSRFQRVSYSQSINQPLSASDLVAPPKPAAAYQPLPPQRIIAGLIGVALMAMVAILMIFGVEHGGPLDGVPLANKLIMAGFAAFLGIGLLLYANPNTRIKAGMIGIALAGGLLAIPFFIKGESPVIDVAATTETDTEIREFAEEAPPDPQAILIRRLQEQVGLRPLEQEIQRLENSKSGLAAYGLFLVDLQESNRIAARDFMMRITSAAPNSHIYPRNEGEYLFVLTGLDMNIERLASMASPLGNVRRIVPELGVIEILIDNGVFIEPPSGILVDRDHPEYFELNLRELSSIDIQRIQRAVQRLAESEPRMYRVDIARRLRELLDEPGVTFHAAIARALRTWDTDMEAAARAATNAAVQLRLDGGTAPPELVSLALKHPSDELIPVIIEQWRANTLLWENFCIEAGPAIEPAMLREFDTIDHSLQQSAARILGRVGGPQSRAALEAARQTASREFEVIINRALEHIATRESNDR